MGERGGMGDADRAAELCRHVILADPSPMAYWVLARTFDSDDGRADWAMAEFYRLQNKSDKSREYARRAKSRLKPGTPEYIKSKDILNSKN